MKPFRVSLSASCGLILLIAVGLGGLRSASGYWASVIVSCTLGLLVVASLGACRGRHRTGWLGFAIAGWAYLGAVYGPMADLRPFLVTSTVIADGYAQLHASSRPLPEWRNYRDDGWPLNPPSGGRPGRSPLPRRVEAVPEIGPVRIMMSEDGFEWVMIEQPSFVAFERTAHSLFAVVVGGLGALLAIWFEGRSHRIEMRSEGNR